MEDLDLYYFKKPPNEYERTLTPVKDYFEQASTYLTKRLGISKEESILYIKSEMKKRKLKNPIVRYHIRQKNNDLKQEQTKMTDYIKDIKAKDELTAPSLTTYSNPKEKKSVQGEFLFDNVAKRNIYKKNMFKAKQDNDPVKVSFNNTLQGSMKIYNNSLSGTYASASTILYNRSSHSTLTSMTRCIASIGNSISESIISGNKHFRKPELVYNYITAIVNGVRMNTVELAIKEYDLYIPKPIDVFNALLKSFKWYWRSKEIEEDLLDYLNKLTGAELAAVLYVNDMFHLRKHNENLIRNMLTKMKEQKCGLTNDVRYLTKSAEGVEILSKIINGELIKGKNLDYNSPDCEEIVSYLASTALNIIETLNKYKLLFRTFLTTDILPISIAYIKDMLRECIVLSDTDSTCGSYGEWVEWYYNGNRFDQDAISLAASIMTINTQAMDHNIKLFASNLSTDNSKVDLLKMKNEFYWPVFTPSNASKHYYANTLIQEGNVYREGELELKGAHLIASTVNQYVVKKVHGMIREVNALLSNGEKISILKYIKEVGELEKFILKNIDEGNISVFGTNTIKDSKSYKEGPDKSVYWNHILWEKVFAEKYGSPGKPPYMFIKIPTLLSSTKKLDDFIETIEDENIKIKFKNEIKRVDKKMFATFRPPMSICSNIGIPKEFINVIDRNRVVEDNLKSGYFFLETLGFYKKANMMIHEMGY